MSLIPVWGFVFKILDFGIFLGRKILASINVSIFRVIPFNAFWKFLWLGNSAWDVFGVKFWSRGLLGF